MIIMRIEKYKFEKEDIEKMMKHYNKDTPEEAIECWAYSRYPLANDCSYYIKRIGKTFIEIGEMP